METNFTRCRLGIWVKPRMRLSLSEARRRSEAHKRRRESAKPPSDEVANRFLEHARAVHFALIATSFALLVASAIRPQVSLQRAFDQAKTAATIMQTNFAYKNLDAFSDKHQAPFIADKRYYMALSQSTKVLDSTKARFENALSLADSSLETSSFDWDSAVQSNGNLWQRMSDGGLLDRDPTLDEFQKAWNFYKDAFAVVMDRDNPQPDRVMYFGRTLLTKSSAPSATESTRTRTQNSAAKRSKSDCGRTRIQVGCLQSRIGM